jgi:hypothetical protein
MQLSVTTQGDLRAQVRAEIVEMERAVKEAVRTAGDILRERIAQDVRSNFGRRNDRGRSSAEGFARSWRSRTFPANQPSMNAASIVWSKAPLLAHAFDEAALITVSRAKYLCIPSQFNLAGGKRRTAGTVGSRNYWQGVKVKPAEMVALGKAKPSKAFIRSSGNGWKTWFLKVEERRVGVRGTRRAFAGGVQVGGRSRFGANRLIGRGYVPMFYLKKQVKMPKLLDLEARSIEALRNLDRLIDVFMEQGSGFLKAA